jgi:hypothetical protein
MRDDPRPSAAIEGWFRFLDSCAYRAFIRIHSCTAYQQSGLGRVVGIPDQVDLTVCASRHKYGFAVTQSLRTGRLCKLQRNHQGPRP